MSKTFFIILLISLNAVPVYGVMFWDWTSFDLIFLYWLENVIIGVFMILRILVRPYGHPLELIMPLFLVPFFSFHYGMFCAVHGMFVISIFGEGLNIDISGMDIPELIMPIIQSRQLFWPVVALFALQLFDWIRDSIERGLGSDSVKELTTKPYRRIMILHVTIIGSGFFVMALNEPLAGLLLLIVFKTGMDIYHWKKDEDVVSKIKEPEITDKMKEKINAFLDEPKVTINGKEIRYNSYDEFKASKHFRLMTAIIRMIGGWKKMHDIEKYIEQELKRRNNRI